MVLKKVKRISQDIRFAGIGGKMIVKEKVAKVQSDIKKGNKVKLANFSGPVEDFGNPDFGFKRKKGKRRDDFF